MYHGHGMGRHYNIMCCWRNFITNEEKIEHLKQYKKSLENEIKGVEEIIEKLKKAN